MVPYKINQVSVMSAIFWHPLKIVLIIILEIKSSWELKYNICHQNSFSHVNLLVPPGKLTWKSLFLCVTYKTEGRSTRIIKQLLTADCDISLQAVLATLKCGQDTDTQTWHEHWWCFHGSVYHNVNFQMKQTIWVLQRCFFSELPFLCLRYLY